MNTNILLDVAKKWNSLGCYTIAYKVDREHGRLKLHRNSLPITQNILNEEEKIPIFYNFLALDLKKSSLVCIDIDNNPYSLSEFYKILGKNSRKISDFFYETSINGGIHIYFRKKNNGIERNIYEGRKNHIIFDVIYTGSVFVYPSEAEGDKYERGEISIFTINTINEIEFMPHFLERFIKNRH